MNAAHTLGTVVKEAAKLVPLRQVPPIELGSGAIRAPGTEIKPGSFSKNILRSPVAFAPSLFQFETLSKEPTLPGSIFRSRSSEKRSMRPKPFDGDVPPLNQTSNPAKCRLMDEIHDALAVEATIACVACVEYRFAISRNRSRLKAPRARARARDAVTSVRDAPA